MYFTHILQSSDTWNPCLDPKLAHILTVVFLTFSLHLIDRQVNFPKSHFCGIFPPLFVNELTFTNIFVQAEYLSRLDYQWKRQLTKEQDEAFHTRNANKLLLRNILPEHVGTLFSTIIIQLFNNYIQLFIYFSRIYQLTCDENNV